MCSRPWYEYEYQFLIFVAQLTPLENILYSTKVMLFSEIIKVLPLCRTESTAQAFLLPAQPKTTDRTLDMGHTGRRWLSLETILLVVVFATRGFQYILQCTVFALLLKESFS